MTSSSRQIPNQDLSRANLYRYKSIALILGEKTFSRKLQNFMGYQHGCFRENRRKIGFKNLSFNPNFSVVVE
ncbi:hypothetical protein T12_4102 [Trichinella patagoniensis]|uniref:Uncharacterized protein n=1 Tax=Trichinella patagoniensis TaxID=990121 RepID=A0A0V0ZQY1_9BILA|nr:hypothetical protein T12_4102 [Trichinella patagoniensis]